jgi:hypothetical protein
MVARRGLRRVESAVRSRAVTRFRLVVKRKFHDFLEYSRVPFGLMSDASTVMFDFQLKLVKEGLRREGRQ